MATQRTKLFIEATPLLSDKMSGIGHVLLETVKALDTAEVALRYDVRLFVPWNERKKMDKYAFAHLSIKRLPYPHKFLSLFSRMKVNPPLDVFLGKGVYVFPNYRNWSLMFSRSLTYVHDACFVMYPEYVEKRNLKYLQKYVPMWLKRTDVVVTVSESSRQEIQEHLKSLVTDVAVVPNAIDQTHFYPRPKDDIDLMRKKYKLGEDYLLYLGNIEPRKNLSTLIAAFRKSAVSSSAELFLVGGDGWLNETIHHEIEQANKNGLRIHRNQQYVPDEDLPALLSGARALVQPSWHEGFGLAVLQAIACGTQVICSDIPSLREVAKRYPESKLFYFTPDSSEQLIQILNKLPEKTVQKVPPHMQSWHMSVEQLLRCVNQIK